MCNCIERINANLVEKNLNMAVGIEHIHINGEFIPSDRVAIKTCRRQGVPINPDEVESVLLSCFCPFCGKKHQKIELNNDLRTNGPEPESIF
jgi:hypothetical protein